MSAKEISEEMTQGTPGEQVGGLWPAKGLGIASAEAGGAWRAQREAASRGSGSHVREMTSPDNLEASGNRMSHVLTRRPSMSISEGSMDNEMAKGQKRKVRL